MAKFEVTTELTISCTVTVEVEADDKQAAMDAVAEILPSPGEHKAAMKDWKADVTIKAPKGVALTSCKPYYVMQASGGDKARKIG